MKGFVLLSGSCGLKIGLWVGCGVYRSGFARVGIPVVFDWAGVPVVCVIRPVVVGVFGSNFAIWNRLVKGLAGTLKVDCFGIGNGPERIGGFAIEGGGVSHTWIGCSLPVGEVLFSEGLVSKRLLSVGFGMGFKFGNIFFGVPLRAFLRSLRNDLLGSCSFGAVVRA